MNEADQLGVTQALRKHNLSHSVFLRWKRQFDTGGPTSLKPQYHKIDPQIKALQEENARLKRVVADLTLDKNILQEVIRKKV